MKNLKYILVSLILVLNFSCSDSKVVADSYGKLTIKLTDAPMPYNQFMEANITIDKIELGNAVDANSFIVIMSQTTTYNMLDLVNGITETLTNMDIPEGQYDTLRLYISSTEMVMNDGTSFTYDMGQSGSIGSGNMMGGGSMMFNDQKGSIDITLDHFMDIRAKSQNDFLMDLDIDHSFNLQGVGFSGMGANMMMSMTGFTFNPTMRFVNMLNAGTIQVTVHGTTENLANATVTLMQNNTVYTTTHTDIDGNYSLIGIPVGDYTIKVEMDGYTMNSVGNEVNMGTLNMTAGLIMMVDFSMILSN